MPSGQNKPPRKQEGNEGEQSPKRDWYDMWVFWVHLAGVVLLFFTLVATLIISALNNRDMDAALDKLSKMAEAQTAASIAEQTPHVSLWVRRLSGFNENQPLVVNIRLKNAARVTLYDGKVSVGMTVVSPENIDSVWSGLSEPRAVVLGPEDFFAFNLDGPQLTAEEKRQVIDGKLAIVAAVRITFTDVAQRPHDRSTCSVFYYRGNGMTVDTCDYSPPQS